MDMAIHSLGANAVLDAAAARPPELQAASQAFNQLMAHTPTLAEPTLGGSGTAAAQVIRGQEALLQQTFQDVRSFSQQAPGMDPSQLMARHIALQYQMAAVQMQMNAGIYVAQSGKNGLQTLMKNQ